MSLTSTILIVDDIPAMSQLIAALLNDGSYQLEFAYSGHEALEKAQALDPDLILLDIMMPDMDGFAVCRALRAMPRLAAAPIILVTALDDRASRLAGLEAGADDFISKPFDPSELRARVRAVTRMNRYRQLLTEQARYQRLIELSPDGIVIVDNAGQIRLANPAMLRMLGADSMDQVCNLPIDTFIAPASRQASRALLGATDDAPAQQRLTAWFLRRNGDAFPAEINAGRFDWDGEAMVQAIVRDITERMRFEEMLHQRNQELALLNRASQRFVSSLDLQQVLMAVLTEVDALFETASAAIWLEDAAAGDLTCWRASGPGSESMQGRRLVANRSLVGCTFSTGEAVLVHDVQLDTKYLPLEETPSGQVVRSILIVPFTAQNKVFGVLQIADGRAGRFTQSHLALVEALAGIAAIATENALLFRAVTAQRSQLRALAGRLAEIQEQEHQQLARELHDQLGQTLTVINLSLDLIGQMLPVDTPQEVQHHLHDASELVEQAIHQVRSVMAELRPPVLDDYGLLAALRWYGQLFALRTGVAAEINEFGPAVRCSPAVETALFRIAQEALNNVAKHAAASKVEISLHWTPQRVRLAIADNGRGFNAAGVRQATDEPHWGFLTMNERALAVGGTLHITSQPGAGATVYIEVAL